MSQLNRKVHIEGVEWKYMVGKKHAVIHVPHLDKKVTVALELLVDKDQREIDRGRKKGSTDGMILPSEVEKYIRKNLVA